MATEIENSENIVEKSGENEEVSNEVKEEEVNHTDNLDDKIETKQRKLEKLRKRKCYLFFRDEITRSIVDDIFEDLMKNYTGLNGKLDIIVDSGGGNIDAAFNLAMLFRRYGVNKLTFIIPRWAKSAATLLVCGGDEILMTPIAELGPLDPQITQLNPLEGRLESFSPLAIESTLDLIRSEFENGNKDMANKLIEKLQFPLTLGSFIKCIEISEEYLNNLLSSKMCKDIEGKKIKCVAEKLTKGYVDHGFCINLEEANDIGLKVKELKGEELEIVWEIYKLYKEKKEIEDEIERKEMEEKIKELPPELLNDLRRGKGIGKVER